MSTAAGWIRSERELGRMRLAGQVVAQILSELQDRIQPGWSTADIDRYAEERLVQLGAGAAFKGYHGFPAATCVCLNHEMVHGVPSPRKTILAGDLVKVDLGAVVDGWHSDASMTLAMSPVSDASRRLIATTREALERALVHVRAGVQMQRISAEIEHFTHERGYQVSRRFMGHGIGLHLHEPPPVPNHPDPQLPNPILEAGMTLAIEPIVLEGDDRTYLLPDGWTVATWDGGRVAQWEYTIVVTQTGYENLTSLS